MEKIATNEQALAGLTVCASPTHVHLCLPPSLLIFISRGTQHFTWTSLEELKDTVYAQQNFVQMQQDEIAALTAAHEPQEQEREVCASPIGITALHALRTILTLGR